MHALAERVQPRYTHLDSKWGIADNWGPYRAALSYNSNNGIASSFMFFGTARTSAGGEERGSDK